MIDSQKQHFEQCLPTKNKPFRAQSESFSAPREPHVALKRKSLTLNDVDPWVLFCLSWSMIFWIQFPYSSQIIIFNLNSKGVNAIQCLSCMLQCTKGNIFSIEACTIDTERRPLYCFALVLQFNLQNTWIKMEVITTIGSQKQHFEPCLPNKHKPFKVQSEPFSAPRETHVALKG